MRVPTASEASANGRVNLIGEHTDYNGGFVLPTAIPQATRVWLNPRADQLVVATTHLKGADYQDPVSYELGTEMPGRGWIDYIQGATKLLREAGFTITGFNLKIESTVPAGSGLSSSAALEICVLKALREGFALDLNDVEMAKIAQRIEREFVGANVGIMDQMACALAQFGEALYLDTKNLTYERVPLPLRKMDLIVINSGIEHKNAAGGYNQRRQQCEAACVILQIEDLCVLGVDELSKLDQLPEIQKKRARHVITENARVHKAATAMRANDLKKLGELFYQSHASMRDDYEITVKGIDDLIDLCRAQEATLGARMTGGGFGGSIVAITQPGHGLQVAETVVRLYNASHAEKATILVP